MTQYRLILVFICLSIQAFFVCSMTAQECRRMPFFINKLGFDPAKTGFSTQERKEMGVILVQFSNPSDPNSTKEKIYQDSSWRIAGYCGAITLDYLGNAYILPAPNVNMLHNPPEKQNTIYRIDGQTGIMSEFLSLPMSVMPHVQNPYGLLSNFLDCENKSLIVSSLAGSDSQHEIGNVFSVDLTTKDYFIILKNTDVLGVSVGNIRGQRCLIFGKARSSEIWSLPLSADNHPVGEPRLEINLSGLGERGDDKARKIRIRQDGSLDIYGFSFFYNLSATLFRQETIYQFAWNESGQSWILVNIR